MRFSGTGCLPCRSKRKKCDEVKPVCRRCAKAGKRCYGYRSAFSVINDENIYASGQQKRPQGPRSNVEALEFTVSLPRDVQSEAEAFYTTYHLHPPEDVLAVNGLRREALLATISSSRLLHLGMTSLALAVFSRAKRCPLAGTLAFSNYQSAIDDLRTALSNLDATNISTCLLTVCLLGQYEDSMHTTCPRNHGTPFVKTLQSQSHHVGAIALLEHWKNSLSCTGEPNYAIRFARDKLREAALLRQVDLPLWLHDDAQFGEPGQLRNLNHIITRLIRIRSKMLVFTTANSQGLPFPASASDIRAIQDEIRSTDGALIEWTLLYPDITRYSRHKLPVDRIYPNSHFSPLRVHSHQGHEKAVTCAQYYGHRILTNHLLIRALELAGSTSLGGNVGAILGTQLIMNCLADELISILPFCLDMVAISNDPGILGDRIRIKPEEERRPCLAKLIAQPLVIAAATPYLKMEHNNWFKSQLAGVGRMTGYGIMASAMTSGWLVL